MTRPNLSDLTLARLLAVMADERDLTSAEIAERFGLSPGHITDLRTKHGLQRVPVNQPRTRRVRVRRMRRSA